MEFSFLHSPALLPFIDTPLLLYHSVITICSFFVSSTSFLEQVYNLNPSLHSFLLDHSYVLISHLLYLPLFNALPKSYSVIFLAFLYIVFLIFKVSSEFYLYLLVINSYLISVLVSKPSIPVLVASSVSLLLLYYYHG